jgi:hypothetical protein
MRFVSTGLVLLLAALAPRAAHAQTTTPTVTLDKNDFELKVETKVDDKWTLLPDIDASLFFNNARCECKTPVAIRLSITATGVAKRPSLNNTNGVVKMYAGPSTCVEHDRSKRPNPPPGGKADEMLGCTLLAEFPNLPELFRGGPQEVETTVDQLFTGGSAPSGKGCSARFSQSVVLWVDVGTDQAPDEGIAGSMAPSLAIAIDGEPPDPPEDVKVTPGNEALNVSWNRPTVMEGENGFLVFCSRAGLPVFKDSYYSGREYHTRQSECGGTTSALTQAPGPAVIAAEVMNGTEIAAPDEFRRLDPAFLCSGQLTSSGEWRIKILQNGIPYVVGVAAVDNKGNASPIETAFVQAPIATRDFFRGYRDAGGAAEGGYCAFGTRGRPCHWTVAGVALGLVLLARRRRKR